MDNGDWRTKPKLWAKLQPIAQEMRTAPTPAENVMWEQLRNRRLAGLRFRRQHTIEKFIADFYCAEAHLVVEIDGPIHLEQQDADQVRDERLMSIGLRVLRLTNEQVFNDLSAALKQIIFAAAVWTPPLREDGEGAGG